MLIYCMKKNKIHINNIVLRLRLGGRPTQIHRDKSKYTRKIKHKKNLSVIGA